MSSDVAVAPRISSVQKMALYETKARFYLVGSNQGQDKFRVLKIDRTEPHELVLIDDKGLYTQQEIRNLLSMIDVGNRPRLPTKGAGAGLCRTVSSFGIVGFIRFMEGYYIILVTKRRKVALIGYHTIYKVEDTTMIYIPHESIKIPHPDEQKYVRLFQSIDLSSNFYFSYSYDVTHSLPYNFIDASRLTVSTHLTHSIKDETLKAWCQNVAETHWSDNVQEMKDKFESLYSATHEDSANCKQPQYPAFAVKARPNWVYLWNFHLIKPMEGQVHPDWVMYLTHGFVGQSNVCVFGRPYYITLIARRSNRYAGTRFLKRGSTQQGHVANEVETEQIVHDSHQSGSKTGLFTSFVQLRGSIPGHWSQDISKMVPKPPILFERADPFSETAGAHFNQLLWRYGTPVMIVNLVKKREKKRQESQLSEEYSVAVDTLNLFLPPKHRIQYISFDMARGNKLKDSNVMSRLAVIAHHCVKRTGIFMSHSPYFSLELRPDPRFRDLVAQRARTLDISKIKMGKHGSVGMVQTGVIRTNCVDCLDRTNTAQFVIGKCALAFQLYALGAIEKPELEFDSDCVRMLEMLYEDHGDVLALQYGGSQLVHRIHTYRRTAHWTAQGSDIMQTLSRYYSNAFSDADKQNAINLFLGVFIPKESKVPIWELLSDSYLHNDAALGKPLPKRSCTQWWDSEVMEHLPLAASECRKTCEIVSIEGDPHEETIDGFAELYRPKHLSNIAQLFAYTMSHSVRDFMPTFTTDTSPFVARVRPGRRAEGAKMEKNPSLTGQSSSTSTNSSSDSEADNSDGLESLDKNPSTYEEEKAGDLSTSSLADLCPSMKQVYGLEIKEPKEKDMEIYRRYTTVARATFQPRCKETESFQFKFVEPIFPKKWSSYEVEIPTVSKESRKIYEEYVLRGVHGATLPADEDVMAYIHYVSDSPDGALKSVA